MRRFLIFALSLVALMTVPAPAALSMAQAQLAFQSPTSMADVVEQVRPGVVMVTAQHIAPIALLDQITQANALNDVLDYLEELGLTSEEESLDSLDDLLDEALDPHTQYLLSVPGLLPASEGFGAGVIIDPSGLILTNAHLIDGCNDFYVSLLDHSEYPARVVGFDNASDIALMQIENTDGRVFPSVPLGSSANLRVGDLVLAIGTPFEEELAQSVSAGIVSALQRSQMGIADYEDFIQTDCAINSGNSGGPLVNMRGEVVGINTAIATFTGTYSGIGFSVPIDQARSVAEQLLSNGRVTRAFMGVGIADLTPSLVDLLHVPGDGGALVQQVFEGTPAEVAGLQAYDAIIACNGLPVSSSNDLRNRISLGRVGSQVRLTVWRNGELNQVNVTLDELNVEFSGYSKGATVLPDPPPPVAPGSFGIEVAEVTPQLINDLHLEGSGITSGVVISRTQPGSFAAFKRLYPGTLVMEINQQPVQTLADYTHLVEASAQRSVLLRVRRPSEPQEILALRRGQ